MTDRLSEIEETYWDSLGRNLKWFRSEDARWLIDEVKRLRRLVDLAQPIFDDNPEWLDLQS